MRCLALADSDEDAEVEAAEGDSEYEDEPAQRTDRSVSTSGRAHVEEDTDDESEGMFPFFSVRCCNWLSHLNSECIFCLLHCRASAAARICLVTLFALRLEMMGAYSGLGGAAKWKERMMERASAFFSRRATDLQTYVYGTAATSDARPKQRDKVDVNGDDDELFQVRRLSATAATSAADDGVAEPDLDAEDALDTSVLPAAELGLDRWQEDGAAEQLRDRFVTGPYPNSWFYAIPVTGCILSKRGMSRLSQ